MFKFNLLFIVFLISLSRTTAQDQSISWATYIGGSSSDIVNSMDIREDGKIIFAGSSNSPDIPVTDDALYNEAEGDANIIGIVNSERELEYLTYFPVNGINDIVFLQNGGYAVCGSVTEEGLPVTEDAFQSSYGGSIDGFVAVFSASHQLVYCSYIGGTEEDRTRSIETDDESNIYLAGETWSSGMLTLGDYSNAELSGSNDGFIMKLSSEGQVLWSTYFGGPASDAFFDVVSGSGTDLYIGGRTSSPFGIATANAAFTELAGNFDYLLLKLNSETGEIDWSTYLGGEGSEFYEIAVNFDSASETVFVLGVTESEANINLNSLEGTELSGYSDLMLTAINSSGNLLWSRYFGGSNTESAKNIIFRGNNVIIVGSTLSEDGIVMGDNPMVDEIILNGGFVASFDIVSGQQVWGTYYNPNSGMGANACVLDDSEILLAGYLDQESVPAFNSMVTANAFQQSYSGGYDGFFMGIQINIPTSVSDLVENPYTTALYPNPLFLNTGNNGLFVETNAAVKKIEIFSLSGVKLLSNIYSDNKFVNLDIPSSLFSQGVYIVRIETSKGMVSKKLIINK